MSKLKQVQYTVALTDVLHYVPMSLGRQNCCKDAANLSYVILVLVPQ